MAKRAGAPSTRSTPSTTGSRAARQPASDRMRTPSSSPPLATTARTPATDRALPWPRPPPRPPPRRAALGPAPALLPALGGVEGRVGERPHGHAGRVDALQGDRRRRDHG